MKEIFKRQPRSSVATEGDASSSKDALWVRCERCRELLYAREHEQAAWVCSKCKHHARISARARLAVTLDDQSFEEFDAQMHSIDPLRFASPGELYSEKLSRYAEESGTQEGFIYGTGRVDGLELIIGVTEFQFAGASMGAAFGEKVTRSMELALERRLPLVLVSNSGGARMQEGTISLLQMAKNVAALDRFKDAGLPYFSIMTDPCLGGITASYAMLGDVNIAEPGAYIGFAGRRVIEQTMRQKLPPNAATAEFLQQHGMVDLVTPRTEIPGVLSRLIRIYSMSNKPVQIRELVEQHA